MLLGVKVLKKIHIDPLPHPPHTLPGIRQNGLDPKAEVYSEPFKTSKMEIFIITVTVNFIFKELW